MKTKRWLISGPTVLPDCSIQEKTIFIEDGFIQDVKNDRDPDADIETTGLIAAGFVDLQINGGYGVDFSGSHSTHDVLNVAARLPETGVTSFLPTIVTSEFSKYPQLLETIRSAMVEQNNINYRSTLGARIMGVHLEGPYINPIRRGAHPLQFIRPISLEEIKKWTDPELVRMVTLAPELPGAIETIQWLRRNGIVVSLGHSDATLEQSREAFQSGARCVTHLFNAMSPFHHREPGLIGAALTQNNWLGLIVDGVHVHPEVIKLVYQSVNNKAIILVTDAMAGLGLTEQEWSESSIQLGHNRTKIEKNESDSSWSVRLDDGTLAGSVLTMDQAVRNMMNFSDCSPGEAIRMGSQNPSRLVKHYSESGKIAPKFPADLVILDGNLKVKFTFIAGECVFPR